MNGEKPLPRSYLLIDGALINDAFTEVDYIGATFPAWLHPIYQGDGAHAGPLLIDVESAVIDEYLDEAMKLANAIAPQLHLSFIDTPLSLTELTLHLRQFNVVRTVDGRLYNLRFSDCVVLSMLEKVLSTAQWASLMGGVIRWCVHDRDGQVRELKAAESIDLPVPTPITLSTEQVARMAELAEPDVMLANIWDIRHGEALPGNASEHHRWAVQAREFWQQAACTDRLVLRWLTSAAVESKGTIFAQAILAAALVRGDRAELRAVLLG